MTSEVTDSERSRQQSARSMPTRTPVLNEEEDFDREHEFAAPPRGAAARPSQDHDEDEDGQETEESEETEQVLDFGGDEEEEDY